MLYPAQDVNAKMARKDGGDLYLVEEAGDHIAKPQWEAKLAEGRVNELVAYRVKCFARVEEENKIPYFILEGAVVLLVKLAHVLRADATRDEPLLRRVKHVMQHRAK